MSRRLERLAQRRAAAVRQKEAVNRALGEMEATHRRWLDNPQPLNGRAPEPQIFGKTATGILLDGVEASAR